MQSKPVLNYIYQYLDEHGYLESLRILQRESNTKYNSKELLKGSILQRTFMREDSELSEDKTISTITNKPIVKPFSTLLTTLEHNSSVIVVRYYQNINRIITGTTTGIITFWHGNTFEKLFSSSPLGSAILSISQHPTNHNLLLLSHINGSLSLISMKESTMELLETHKKHSKFCVSCIMTESHAISISYDHYLSIYQIVNCHLHFKERIQLDTALEFATILNPVTIAFSLRERDSLGLLSLETFKIKWISLYSGAISAVPLKTLVSCLTIAISSDNSMLAISLDNDSVYLYSISLDSKQPLKRIAIFFGNKANEYSRPRLVFDSNNEYLISTSNDQSIIIWNIHDQKVVKRLNGHENVIRDVDCKGSVLVSASSDKTAKVWSR